MIRYVDNMDPDKGLPSLENESIPLAFYSPPYWNYIEYDGGKGIGNKEETYKEYLANLGEVNACLFDKIIKGGRVVINVANIKSRKAVEGVSYMMYPIAHHITKIMNEIGFHFFDEVIWDKINAISFALKGGVLFGSYPYPPTPKIAHVKIEYILVFIKEGNRKVSKEIKEKSKLSLEEWREFTKGIWSIQSGSNRKHPATFPIELAERVIRLYSFFGDTVLDPFAGIGTTIDAAEKWGRRGIGYEISESYSDGLTLF